MINWLKLLFTSLPVGMVRKFKNLDKHHRADDHYYFVKVKLNGKNTTLAFTDSHLNEAIELAEKNKEDIV